MVGENFVSCTSQMPRQVKIPDKSWHFNEKSLNPDVFTDILQYFQKSWQILTILTLWTPCHIKMFVGLNNIGCKTKANTEGVWWHFFRVKLVFKWPKTAACYEMNTFLHEPEILLHYENIQFHSAYQTYHLMLINQIMRNMYQSM